MSKHEQKLSNDEKKLKSKRCGRYALTSAGITLVFVAIDAVLGFGFDKGFAFRYYNHFQTLYASERLFLMIVVFFLVFYAIWYFTGESEYKKKKAFMDPSHADIESKPEESEPMQGE